MPDKNISHRIMEATKKLGLNYTSINPNYNEFCEDIKRLGNCCAVILNLIDEVDHILARHNIRTDFKEKIQKEFEQLHNIDHDLRDLAQLIIGERVKKEKK